jgi:hypothetical protein
MRVAAAVVVALLLGGCSGTSSTERPALRGFSSDSARCHFGLDDFSEVVVPAVPSKLVVCGVRHHRLVPLKTLSRRDGPAYANLIAALSLPDIPVRDECGDVAGPEPIMAVTTNGNWTIAIPGDGCDRVRQEVKDALLAANVPPQYPPM